MLDRNVTAQGAGITRRAAIALGGAAALTLTGARSAFALVTRRSGAQLWSRASFASLVGGSFSVNGLASPLQLVSVRNLAGQPAGSNVAFALQFQAGSGVDTLPGNPPVMQHSSLGSFPIFLTPGDKGTFTAVINRAHG